MLLQLQRLQRRNVLERMAQRSAALPGSVRLPRQLDWPRLRRLPGCGAAATAAMRPHQRYARAIRTAMRAGSASSQQRSRTVRSVASNERSARVNRSRSAQPASRHDAIAAQANSNRRSQLGRCHVRSSRRRPRRRTCRVSAETRAYATSETIAWRSPLFERRTLRALCRGLRPGTSAV